MKVNEEDYSQFIDGIFRYFEYLIIVGGTFGLLYYKEPYFATLVLFFGALGVLGGYADRVSKSFGIESKPVRALIVIFLLLFNAWFVGQFLTALGVKLESA